MTAVVDCKHQYTEALNRSSPSHISHSGIVLVGSELLEDKIFKVSPIAVRVGYSMCVSDRRSHFGNVDFLILIPISQNTETIFSQISLVILLYVL